MSKPTFTFTFGFTCECGNGHPANFYTMPVEGLKPDNTFGFMDGTFRLVCKVCKKEYVAGVTVRRFADVSKKE